MAAGLGFKEFTTGDVLTAADANGYLASQVVMVFANSAARTAAIASPQEGMISYLKDTNSTEYYSGSAWTAIAGGAAGKVLQVVSATTATSATINTSTFTDTNLTVSITPSSTSSRVLVMVTQGWKATRSDSGLDVAFRLNRGATTVYAPHSTSNVISEAVSYTGVSSINALQAVIAFSYVDSPSSTSSLAYKTQGMLRTTSNSGTFTVQPDNFTSSIIAIEIGA